MKLQGLTASFSAALLIGIVQTYLIIFFWAHIAMYTPLPRWLIAQGVSGAALHTVLFATDFIISVLLSLPAAFLLCKLRPRKLLVYLALAVLPGFLWQYRSVLGDTALLRDLSTHLPGILSTLFSLATATLVVRRLAPNNSFKPKPLRGSA